MALSNSLSRRFGTVLTASAGAMNVVSALYPAIPARMEVLRDVLPLQLIRGSQTATVLTGFFLILLADGLRKRRRRAMHITVALLVASSVLHLTKGLDFEEAGASVALSAFIIATRRAYNVASALPGRRLVPEHVLGIVLVYYGYLLLGFIVLRQDIRPAPAFASVLLEPFRLLGDAPHYRYLSAQAHWFQRSLVLLGCVALLSVLAGMIRPLIPRRHAASEELVRARALVKRFGSDTLSYFAFQHGRSYFFDDSGDSFLSYRLWRSVAIVGGHATGPEERIPALVTSFLLFCEANGLEPCFLGIAGKDVAVYNRLDLRTLKIGEEALIDLPTFSADSLKRKVRRAARHAEELGLRTVVFRRDHLPAELERQMHEISRQWVKARGGGERGFSMTLGRLPGPGDSDCEIVTALDAGDRLWGYVCLVPAYSGNAWSLDAMRRREDAPNGLMEYLVIRAAESYRDRAYSTLSLNFATLSNSQNNIDSRAIDATRRFLYHHLSSVYQLRSLQQFNDKFGPYWQNRYLAYRDVTKIPKLAIAIAQAEDPIKISLPAALFRRT